eukprot:Gregarina_sp_Pseudo_9__2334@NODE_2646_length_924_cov_4_340113_g2427_i0_p1_GENE_NODE_2646_length_924_cov_4_340113_g2427_i0NODE_2646_length_924_cov_4_340113_g2427_i0_p1_ORF_typecomplete_len237_score42_63LemA/PF04011_12/1_4e02LemA/PF04011_12/1_7_NODE_2646_length_924_cov_4_340113_g2427_i084794
MTSPPGTVTHILTQAKTKAKQQSKFYEEGVKYLTNKIRSDDNSLVHSILTNSPPLSKTTDAPRAASKPPTSVSPGAASPPIQTSPPPSKSIPPSVLIAKYAPALDILEQWRYGCEPPSAAGVQSAAGQLQLLLHERFESCAQRDLATVCANIGVTVALMQTLLASLFTSGRQAAARDLAGVANTKAKLNEALAELQFLVTRFRDLQSHTQSENHVVHCYVAQRLYELIVKSRETLV